jgi:DNA-binding CsgD family transcriptional regulator
MMPIHAFDNKEIIGHICFIFQKEIMIEINELLDIKILFETLVRPMYDNSYNFIYSKCVRVDEHLKLLTKQEKRIAKKVLEGKTYPEIAEIFKISVNTIKTHMKNIFNKYQVNSKMELFNKLSVPM